MFGDESGLWWNTPPRVNRNAGPRSINFDASKIIVQSNWTCPDDFPTLHGPTAIDVETEDPTIKSLGPAWAFAGKGKVVGVAIANEEGQWYFPTQHENGCNLDHGQVMRWLGAQLAKPEVEPIMANAGYDIGWLKYREGLRIAGKCHDVQIMMALLDEHRFEYGLDALGRDVLGVGKDETLLMQALEQAGVPTRVAKSFLWKLPPQYVGPYGEMDARVTYDLWVELKRRLWAEGLQRIYALEQSQIPIAAAMRARGIRTDPDKAEQVRKVLLDKEGAIVGDIKAQTGVNVDAWDTGSIARACRAVGIEPPRTATGKDSVTKQWLATLDHPIGEAVRKLRIYNKARTTFIDGHILGHAHNGRIHCQFHQLRGEDDEGGGRGTITGRYSCSDPNIQQIPKREAEIKRLVRSLCLPDEGQEWAALDYSSQEPRLIVHFAALAKVPGGAEARQRYLDNPRTDYHQMVADFCGISREEAKPINLGIGYGMGGAKLCRELGLPTAWCAVYRQGGRTVWREVDLNALPDDLVASNCDFVEVAGREGKELLEKYHSGAPFIKGMIELCTERGNRRGYINTLMGRKGRFPKDDNGRRLETHAALNKLAQGSAADQTKEAMRILYEDFGIVPLLTMHDELGLSTESYRDARFAADVMELAVQLQVPSIVDVKMGPSWGEVSDRDPQPSMGRGTLARERLAA